MSDQDGFLLVHVSFQEKKLFAALLKFPDWLILYNTVIKCIQDR